MKSIAVGRQLLLTCMTVLLIHCCIIPTHATPVLDQSYLPLGLGTRGGGTVLQLAQTFTSTLKGLLTHVDVVIALVQEMDAKFEIRPVTNGLPVADNSQVLATLPIALFSSPGLTQPLTSFDLTPFSIFVNPGDALAFTLTSVHAVRVGPFALLGNPDYLGGRLSSGRQVHRMIPSSPKDLGRISNSKHLSTRPLSTQSFPSLLHSCSL